VPQAIEFFERAIARDPAYALAHAGLADAFSVLGWYGFCHSLHAFKKAREAAERAIAIDDTLSEGHCSLALIQYFFGWDFAAAETEFRRAIALNPVSALPHLYLAVLFGTTRRFDEAVAEARRAQELEPLSPLINGVAGLAYWAVGHYSDGVDACQRALEIDPSWGPAKWVLSLSYEELGRHDDAIAVLQDAAVSLQGSPLVTMLLGASYARAGRSDEAKRVLDELKSRTPPQYAPPFSISWIHMHLGELDEAFDWLSKALDDRNASLFVLVKPGLEHVRSDPRYAALLRKAGLDFLVDEPR
jgi:tetratricopeptide (TPR) repeat protein